MIRLQRITTADTDLYSYMEKINDPNRSFRGVPGTGGIAQSIQIPKTHFYNNIIFHNNTR